MSGNSETDGKFTDDLRDKLKALADDETVEVIIRLKDIHAFEGSTQESGVDRNSKIRSEMKHAEGLMADLVEFLRGLEQQGGRVKLIDTSWLTHSVMASATPRILDSIAEREDIDLIDINSELRAYR